MANKITTILDLNGNRFITGIRQVIEQVKQADGTLNKFRVGVDGMFAAFAKSPTAIGAAGAAFGAFAKKAVTDASNLEESVNAVDVSFGAAAESVHEIGKNSDTALGLSQRAFNELAVQLSSFAKNIAGSTSGAPAVIEDLTQRIADFASVQNLDVEEAGRVFISTLAGETEAIRRYGKDISAARVEQFAFANGLIKTKSELTESVKVQARYGLLMQETADTAGDFANTSEGLANQQRIMSAQVENLAASFGEKLTPIVADAASTINDLIATYDALKDKVSGDGGGGGSLWGNLWKTADAKGIGGVVQGIEDLADGVAWLRQQVEPANEVVVDGIDGWARAAAQSDRYADSLEAAGRAARNTDAAIAAGQAQQDRYLDWLIDSGEAAIDQAEAEQEAADALEEKRERLIDAIDSFGDYERAQLDVEDAQDRLAEAEADYNRLLSEGKVSAEDKADALEDVARANERVDRATAEVAEAVAAYNDLMRDSIATDREKADALRAVEDAQRAVDDNIRDQQDALRAVEDAERALADARQDLADLKAEQANPQWRQDNIKTARDVLDANRALEDAERDVEEAERDLEDAHRRVEDAQRDNLDANQDLTDAQEEQRRLLEEGTVTDEEKRRALDEVTEAQGRLEQANRDANQAVIDYQGILRDSIPTDAEKEAAVRAIETAQLDLIAALGNQATAWATEKGAIEGSTTALALQRQELERLRDEVSPSVRDELDRLIAKYNEIPGVGASFSQLPVGVREGTIQVNVSVDAVLNNPAETGRQVAYALDAYFRAGGAPPPGLARIFLS